MSSIPRLLQFSSVSHLGSFVYNNVIVKWRQEGVGLHQTTPKAVPRLCVHHSLYIQLCSTIDSHHSRSIWHHRCLSESHKATQTIPVS